MLDVRDLYVSVCGNQVVRGLSFSVDTGEIVGIVGESGCGKSMTALATAGLLPSNASASGRITFWGRALRAGKHRSSEWLGIRGCQLGMVFQEPSTCLNPLITVGDQVGEVLRLHKQLSEKEAAQETARLFSLLGLHPADRRMKQYPHQLSGGMNQRVMLAAAIACRPKLLIADEPTTALDVSAQAQILHLLKQFTEEAGTSLLLISHDFGVIAQLADRVMVMHAGQVVEEAPVQDLFAKPLHPYTRLLLDSLPRLEGALPATIDVAEEMEAPSGCRFSTRCSENGSLCAQEPPLSYCGNRRKIRCHYRR